MQEQIIKLQQSQNQLLCQMADKQQALTVLTVLAPPLITTNNIQHLMAQMGRDKPKLSLSFTPFTVHDAKEWAVLNLNWIK
eukprot:8787713-Ditylum_brightwellii.AAC.1